MNIPGAEQKSDAILETIGRFPEAWCQYFINPPASWTAAADMTGSFRYTLMSSIDPEGVGSTVEEYLDLRFCI